MSLRKTGRGLAPFVLGVLVLGAAWAAADSVEVAGVVRDETGRPVGGVNLTPVDGGPGAESDPAGGFRLNLPPGRHPVRVTAAGRASVTVSVEATAAGAPLEITVGALRLKDDVVVQAIRAAALAPVTKTDLRREDIERLDYGQEMPVLLKETPSMTQYSETGLGAGYAYFYLRGIQQTRVNMTLDGVPLNEAEDSTLYFVDFDGLAGSLDSIQVQRGVGTSSVGSAAFAGSVNFESVALSDRRELQALVSAGSFGTYRTAVGGQTGQVGPGLAFYGRVLFGGTDGFREHSGVDQHTVFFGARRQGDRSIFKLFGFSGREKTSWPSWPWTRTRSSRTCARTRSRPTSGTASARTSCRHSGRGCCRPPPPWPSRATTTGPRATTASSRIPSRVLSGSTTSTGASWARS